MTAWEHMVANSILAEADGDAWEHLINPAGIGGGITYTGEVIEVKQVQPLILDQVGELIEIIEMPTANVEEIDIISEIVEITEDNIDGIC